MSKHLEAINAAELFLNNYQGGNHENLPWRFLLALVQLSKQYAVEGVSPKDIRFTAKEIHEEMLGMEGVQKSKVPSAFIRGHYKKLDGKLLPKVEDQLNSILIEHNMKVSFCIKNQSSSGGASNPTYYWIEPNELDTQTIAHEKEILDYEVPEGGLRYFPEQSSLPFYSKWLGSIDLLGWKRGLWVALIFLMYMPLIFVGITPLLISVLPSWQTVIVELFTLSVLFLLISVFVLNPIHRMIQKRVIRAPEILALTTFDNLLLEFRTIRDNDNKPQHKQIKLISYTAKCPVCNGKIEIESGGLTYWGRLVGKCNDSPREHIFSFDHITRTGSPLRHTR